MGGISPQAVVHPEAEVGADVTIGPFCVVGPGVRLADGCTLRSHVVLEGPTEIGPGTEIFQGASIGGPPQDLKYRGGATHLVVGARNVIRECVTLNRGTEDGGGRTVVGDDNLFMAYCHGGHDSVIGNKNIFANNATLAGHVEVGNEANIGAFSAVHQFCRVADHAFIGGFSVVTRDALPWVTTVGNRAKAYGLNSVGLRRRGYSRETVQALKSTYHRLFQSKLQLEEALEQVSAEFGDVPEVRYFVEFVRGSKRGVCR